MTPKTPAYDRSPIFILGMLQRSGTNYLSDLIALHPDATALSPIYEDHLIRRTHLLRAYVNQVASGWSPEWGVPADEAQSLLEHLGRGILDWLAGHDERRIVTKMPKVEQAQNFFDLFPSSPLVLLIRDGRNVVASGVQSFGWSFEWALRAWASAADRVLALQRTYGARPNLITIRYEEANSAPEATALRLCQFAGLDPSQYPVAEANRLPVRGSSNLASIQSDHIHWEPVARSSDFDPSKRWEDWSDYQRRRFDQVAGRQQKALGYDLFAAGRSFDLRSTGVSAVELFNLTKREVRSRAGRAKQAIRIAEDKVDDDRTR